MGDGRLVCILYVMLAGVVSMFLAPLFYLGPPAPFAPGSPYGSSPTGLTHGLPTGATFRIVLVGVRAAWTLTDIVVLAQTKPDHSDQHSCAYTQSLPPTFTLSLPSIHQGLHSSPLLNREPSEHHGCFKGRGRPQSVEYLRSLGSCSTMCAASANRGMVNLEKGSRISTKFGVFRRSGL